MPAQASTHAGDHVITYVGQADAAMDDKNRLTIPKKFRRLMPDSASGDTVIWLIPGYDAADFMIMDDDYGARWARAITESALGGGAAARRKQLLGRSERVEVDKAGRALVPQTFLDHCRVTDREFKILGYGDHLEVFAPASWQRLQASLTAVAINGLWDETRAGGTGE